VAKIYFYLLSTNNPPCVQFPMRSKICTRACAFHFFYLLLRISGNIQVLHLNNCVNTHDSLYPGCFRIWRVGVAWNVHVNFESLAKISAHVWLTSYSFTSYTFEIIWNRWYTSIALNAKIRIKPRRHSPSVAIRFAALAGRQR